MIPCKDCITFAMCKLQITGHNKYGKVVEKLLPKCSLIRQYTKPSWQSTYNYSPSKVDRIRFFFENERI